MTTQDYSRRDFVRNMTWMGAAATLTGCALGKGRAPGPLSGSSMIGHALKPMARVRVGMVGLGKRGGAALKRLSQIPVVDITAICDVVPERVEKGAQHLVAKGRPAPQRFTGERGWERLCGLEDVDVVYCCTHWLLHAPVALRAMKEGKVALTEVPGALTVDDCWALVETGEATRLPCMLLENACYAEEQLAVYMMQRAGLFGEMVYADVGYIHDLRVKSYNTVDDPDLVGYWNHWRLRWNQEHAGDAYPTHQLSCPAKYYFGFNAGDRMDYLVSMSSKQANFEAYARATFPADDWRAKLKLKTGDISVALVKSVKEKMVILQHSVSSPRPYTVGSVVGTKGVWAKLYAGYGTYGLGFDKKPGGGVEKFMPDEERLRYFEKYAHPLWRKDVKELCTKVGGHGGKDFLMDIRWVYCLVTGQPLDMDVYDLASWSSLVELTERSEAMRGRSVDIPDFTRGAWETALPPDPARMTVEPRVLGIADDPRKLSGEGQMSV